MSSLFLRVASRVLLPGLMLFSIWILIRGHNDPGGGFIAGLIAAAGFALRTFATDAEVARKQLGLAPSRLIGAGLLVALTSGLLGWIFGGSFLAALWLPEVPVLGKLGTPLLFDAGIYLLVLGAVTASIMALSEVET